MRAPVPIPSALARRALLSGALGAATLGLAVSVSQAAAHGSDHPGRAAAQGPDRNGRPAHAGHPGRPDGHGDAGRRDSPGRPGNPHHPDRWARSGGVLGSRAERAVYAHRGASGYRPEHTIAAYELAIEQGADVIEPDLVATRDGVLVDRHENEISGTTDVAARLEFAGRRTTRTIDGSQVTGWFTEDFTLAELRTLRAKERLPELRPDNTAFDGRYLVPTFQEVIDLARRASRRTGRTIALAPEIKHSTYFRSIGTDQERELVRVLRRNGLDSRRAPVIVQ
ncbi:MAG: glycerophosphodiester phosphodiesterase family protein, partial [Solirubrobacteraceae bacterium]